MYKYKVLFVKGKYLQLLQRSKHANMVKIIENYVLNEAIGEGNFGSVYRATNKTKPGNFAVKVIPIEKFQQNDKLQTYISNQIEALSTIGESDFIIRYYQVIKSKHNYYIVYEFCDGGTLQDLLKKQQHLEETKALMILRQLLQAFKVLNKNNIMHRDLKPQNIFFTSDTNMRKVKLGDFGFCKGLKPDQNLAKTMLGSPIYMAPEVLKGESYTTKADVWSLGVILYEMIYGFCPYESKSIASLISTIDTKPIYFPQDVKISQKTQNLIKKMLTKDYFRRMGWVQLFGYKINENGEYIEEKPNEQSSTTKKVFSSLFGSMSTPMPMPISQNSRSYSMVKDQETDHREQTKQQLESLKKIIDTGNFSTSKNLQIERTSSQPKEKKKFYSQKYMKIFSTPLSLEKKMNKNLNSKAEDEVIQEPRSNISDKNKDRVKEIDFKNPTSPQYSRNERILSNTGNTDNLNNMNSKEINGFETNSIEERNYTKYSSSNYKPEGYKFNSEENNRVLNENIAKNENGEDKRTQLLKKHGNIEKVLKQILGKLQINWKNYKNEEENRSKNMESLKIFLEDAYVLLNYIQQKLKQITTNIKITETSLLDMASLVNYEHIQVGRFIIQLRNELLRWGSQQPSYVPSLNSRIQKNQNGTPNFQSLLNSSLKDLAREYL